jgi:hypothetical protein
MQSLTYVVCLIALLSIASLWIRFMSRRPPRIRKDQVYLAVCHVCCGVVEMKTGPAPLPGDCFVHRKCVEKIDEETLSRIGITQRLRFES